MTPESTAKMTNMGFDWGDMSVERCYEHKGYRCIRVRSIATGFYVDIELSPKGHRLKFTKPKRDKKLAGYDPCGNKQTFESVFVQVTK